MIAARADTIMGIIMDPVPSGDCTDAFRAKLKRYARRLSAALMERQARANLLGDWLETSLGHLCLVFSPLKERGPPRA